MEWTELKRKKIPNYISNSLGAYKLFFKILLLLTVMIGMGTTSAASTTTVPEDLQQDSQFPDETTTVLTIEFDPVTLEQEANSNVKPSPTTTTTTTRTTESANSNDSTLDNKIILPILYDSSVIDSEFQSQLLTAVQIAIKDFQQNPIRSLENREKTEFLPKYIDLDGSKPDNLKSTVELIHNEDIETVLSLLSSEGLQKFQQLYDQNQNETKSDGNIITKLQIISPRLLPKYKNPSSTKIISMQMTRTAHCRALLHRVRKVGVEFLIPIVDEEDNEDQLEFLQTCNKVAEATKKKQGNLKVAAIQFVPPIFVTPFLSLGRNSSQLNNQQLKNVFGDEINKETNFSKTKGDGQGHSHDQSHGRSQGIFLLAKKSSKKVIEVASKSKNAFPMRWFSPDLVEFEEWAGIQDGKKIGYEATFGIYSVLYVGARGWDNNPSRRHTLRELHYHNEASPRILASILAYDATWLAKNSIESQNHDQLKSTFSMQGLSGEISFDENGFRREGTFFGVSSVPQKTSALVSLLQPSSWILEDVLYIKKYRYIHYSEGQGQGQNRNNQGGQYSITEYNVATSSLLTKEELIQVADNTASVNLRTNSNLNSNLTLEDMCEEHLMEVMARDPFTQMPSIYRFRKHNLPAHLIIPNEHGYGITFMCGHRNSTTETKRTTMKIACTPTHRNKRRFNLVNPPSQGVKCFRSHFQSRHVVKRSTNETKWDAEEDDDIRSTSESNLNLTREDMRTTTAATESNLNEAEEDISSHYKLDNHYYGYSYDPYLHRTDGLRSMYQNSEAGNNADLNYGYDNSYFTHAQDNHVYYTDSANSVKFEPNDAQNSIYNNWPGAHQYQQGIYGTTTNAPLSYLMNEPFNPNRRDSPNYYYYNNQVSPFPLPIPAVSTTMSTSMLPSSKDVLPELRRLIKVSKSFVGGCVGSATGCAMCALFLGRFSLGSRPTSCIGSCTIGIVSACNGMLAKVLSESTTVICTELFRQGYLDIDTFLADAEFGRKVAQESPVTLKGYQILARPLVKKMRDSKILTKIVSTFALPWAQYMKYSVGYSDEFSWLGYAIHLVGSPLCFIVGHIHSSVVYFGGIIGMFSKHILLMTGRNDRNEDLLSSILTVMATIVFLVVGLKQAKNSFRQKQMK